MNAPSRRHRVGADLAVVGSALGVLAGVVQATVGTDIPEWTGAKASPGALGLLTVVLSAVAGAGALTLRKSDTRLGGRLAATAIVVVTGLVCFTTVGRLWLVPGPLLLTGAVLSVENWKSAAVIVRHGWLRILLAALGACELLMAAGASLVPMIVGAIGGLSLIGAAWIASRNRLGAAGLMALGTIPFAVIAWTALVPLLVLLVAAGLATPVLRTEPRVVRSL
jgi:hypothetical protein